MFAPAPAVDALAIAKAGTQYIACHMRISRIRSESLSSEPIEGRPGGSTLMLMPNERPVTVAIDAPLATGIRRPASLLRSWLEQRACGPEIPEAAERTEHPIIVDGRHLQDGRIPHRQVAPVDRDDINAIFAAIGQRAVGIADPRDANRDGLISINDVRKCVLSCARANCAAN